MEKRQLYELKLRLFLTDEQVSELRQNWSEIFTETIHNYFSTGPQAEVYTTDPILISENE